MGASGWAYYVGYEADMNNALASLRNAVFRGGKFETPNDLTEMKREYPGILDSIETLVEACGESGTHSILDINGLSENPEFGKVSRLSDSLLREYFGTNRPTKEDVEETKSLLFQKLPSIVGTWGGLYLTVYRGESASEVFIIGMSGD